MRFGLGVVHGEGWSVAMMGRLPVREKNERLSLRDLH